MKRSKFSLSHYNLLTCDMGNLIPVTWFESIPGDTVQHSTSALVRVSPLNTPVMHPVMVRLHHWFVPFRLIWEDWEDFITGGEDGIQTPAMPSLAFGNNLQGTLPNYLGYPVGNCSSAINENMLPFRAYNLIWNEWYRDQQLQTAAAIALTSGNDAVTDTTVQKVCWNKDYFTSARPDSDLGDAISIPLTGNAPVISDGTGIPKFDFGASTGVHLEQDAGGISNVQHSGASVPNADMQWNDPELIADMTSVSSVEISDLRLALAVQRYQERMNKYGSRYSEYLKGMGVRSSDARLQRPEYLGGGRQVIQFSEVLSMNDDGTRLPGKMYGHGISAMRSNRYRKFFEEHGIIMTLLSVLPKTIYVNSIPRFWHKTVKEDFFQRELQFIGDQEVYNREIKIDHATPDDIFGYQSRYDEYRTIQSSVKGEFDNTLNTWHYARDFAADPALNSTFVEATPTKRVNQSTGTDCLYVMCNHSIQARRQLAKVATNKTF